MNREIKFRAWNSYAQKFIYFSNFIITDDGTLVSSQDGFTKPNLGNWIINSKDVELQQSTGLKDKNGKEIFEGDIIDYGGNLVVTYCPDINNGGKGMNVGWYLQNDDFERWTELENESDYVVIGNIHENPELLK